ncbi:MAG: bifunctional diguanylate cyclase/phosphohydrolase [Armatimonadota bacterium]
MLVLARVVDTRMLSDLAPGTGHRVVFCSAEGEVTSAAHLGSFRALPQAVASAISGSRFPDGKTVEMSTDNNTSYGILPLHDLAGKPLGVLIDVRSIAAMMASLSVIKQMSVSLMLLCAVIAAVGFGYLSNRALALRAHRDELTGLYNHGYLQDYLRSQVQLAERYDRPLAVIMVDIDHFKFVNDSHGHATGDAVLKALAQTMLRTMRATDVAARYGGEEFVVVMPETDLPQALAAAERLRAAVQELTVPVVGLKGQPRTAVELTFTVSLGVASYPDDGRSAPELLEAADAGLMEAKRTRNTVCAYRDVVKDAESKQKRITALGGFLRDSSIATIRPLVTAIDTREPGSVLHSQKTAEFAVAIGREMGLTTHELAHACKAALLHDVGMIGVPDQILTKSDKLTSEELSVVRQHCRLGADIILQSPQLAVVADIVLHHHERWDGQGYPAGLAGNKIPLAARIIAVADSLDAMTSPRSYKKAMSLQQALEELRAQSGKQFDPDVVEAAGRVIEGMLEQQQERAAA